MLTNSQKLFKKDISLKMLLELFILSSVFGPAQPLVLGGQPLGMNDSQYLHLLLADEKQARMQLQNHVNSLETTITDLQDRLAELEETGPCGLYIHLLSFFLSFFLSFLCFVCSFFLLITPPRLINAPVNPF